MRRYSSTNPTTKSTTTNGTLVLLIGSSFTLFAFLEDFLAAIVEEFSQMQACLSIRISVSETV